MVLYYVLLLKKYKKYMSFAHVLQKDEKFKYSHIQWRF